MTTIPKDHMYMIRDPLDTTTIQHIATWAYLMDRTPIRRWLYQVHAILARKLNEGWTYDNLYMAGLLKEEVERTYGLTPDEAQSALDMYPLTENGSFWEALRRDNIPAYAHIVFCRYSRLPVSAESDLMPKSLKQQGRGIPEDYNEDNLAGVPDQSLEEAGFVPVSEDFIRQMS